MRSGIRRSGTGRSGTGRGRAAAPTRAARAVALTSLVALLVVACTSPGSPGTTTEPTADATPSGSATSEVLVIPATSLVEFGTFAGVPLLDADDPAYAGPATPTSLAEVNVPIGVSGWAERPGVPALLESQGFAVVPSGDRMVYYAYQGNDYEGVPSYVTTDVGYHVWHLAFDKALRDLEQDVFLPRLESLLLGALAAAEAQTAELADTPLADAASRAEQLYQVAAAELGLDVTLGPLAEQERALIAAAGADPVESPILGNTVTYALFTPRGRYTVNDDLTRYFLAMSVLGQLGFCLPGTIDCPDGPLPVQTAVLASRALVADDALVALWREVYEPTAFLVGLADDYSPRELAAAAAEVDPGWLADPSAFASAAAAGDLVAELADARPVLINPDRASVRLMGSRFVIDSFILDQLIYENVGTLAEPRSLPSGLDVAAALGSTAARQALEDRGEMAYANYESQLDAMTAAVAARPVADWAGTVYDAWLYAIQAAFAPRGAAFPDYQRTDAWAAKDLQTGLASYAELKRDTILYAKQAFAEGGGDLEVEGPVRHWVEPDPVAFERLAAAADLMRQGLADRGLLPAEQDALLADVSGLQTFLGRVARAELAGEVVAAVDAERLAAIGEELEGLALRASDEQVAGPVSEQDAAVIADIATGTQGEVLEIATGRFDRFLVVVPDASGGFAVAQGAVNSFYEFVNADGIRLTDEAWRALLDTDPPDRPTWQAAFLAQ